jgi:hypothetical protein
MNAAILQKESEIEQAVMDATQPGKDYKPVGLAENVASNRGNADWTQDAVLAAIWRLISEGKLILSQQRMLRRRS